MSMKYHEDTAFFANDEKTVIFVQVTENNGNREADFQRTIIVEPNPVFEEFSTQVSLEKVEENTVKLREQAQKERDEQEQKYIDRIKAQLGGDIIATDAPKSSGFDPNALEAEDLFKLKLQSFEIEEVKSSKNRELKAKIRKGNSFMEVVAFTAATILDSRNVSE